MPSKSKEKKLLNAVILETDGEELQAYLRDFAQKLASEIADTAPDRSEEVLCALITELALSAADQRRSRERRQKQAKGIAAAKARGVQFGRRAMDLPEGFEETHRAWREGELSLCEAARQCNMSKTTFRNIALRKENAANYAQC